MSILPRNFRINVISQTLTKFFDKKDLYLSLSTQGHHFDDYGWWKSDKCDGLLYNCLWSIAGANIDIISARDENKKWHRHPSFTCYKNDESKSEISKDMLLGLLLWIIIKKDPIILQQLLEFGEKNNWTMGEGDISRTYLTAALRGSYYQAAHFLYKRSSIARFFPKGWAWPLPLSVVVDQKGYRRHLQALHIYALSLMRPATKREIDIMRHHASDQNLNALHRAIYNSISNQDQSDAIHLLLNERYFPAKNLPTNHEYRAKYLFSNDQSSLNWIAEVGADVVTHPGIDFLFAAKIIEMDLARWKKISYTKAC